MRFALRTTLTLALLAAAISAAGCGADGGLGAGSEVSPKGALYSYRIPANFQSAKVLKVRAAVQASFAFTTAVGSKKAQKHRGEGITVGQPHLPPQFAIDTVPDLRAQVPQLDDGFRASVTNITGATVSAPQITQVAGHPAVAWTATGATSGPYPDNDSRTVLVFAGHHTVEVVCRWGRTAAEKRLVLTACDALLRSMRIARAKPSIPTTTTPSDPQQAAVTTLLEAVFANPTAAQCTTAMAARYVKQTFGPLTSGERKVASTAQRVCEIHQTDRAKLDAPTRNVTVTELKVHGDTATATLRGSNGYPTAVALTRNGGSWQVDVPGAAPTGPGSGKEVAPDGSLYAYRIPTGFRPGHVLVGPVNVTGSAFSTGVASPKAPKLGDGVAIAQTTFRLRVHDAAALRAQLAGFVSSFRRVLEGTGAKLTGSPMPTQAGGRPALVFTTVLDGVTRRTTVVFSSAVPVIVAVDCVWHRSPAEATEVQRGCDAVLASLRVK